MEEWKEDLLLKALELYGESIAGLVARYHFMYDDYFEQGMSPQQALVEEWG
jgi:hypothetical protein